MAKYTVRARDCTQSHWCFIDQNLNISQSQNGRKPLILAEARKARRLMIDSARKFGWLIECEVVRIEL